MPKMLRHRKTGELMPMNADTARHEDMMTVEMPDMSKMEQLRGVAHLTEKHVFDSVEDAPVYEAPKTEPEPEPEPVAAEEDDVDLSDIELPDDDD